MSRMSTEERQAQIVDEAISIIHERGYSAITIRELARRVGISEPAIYRHFDSKADIVDGILARMSGSLEPLIASLDSARSDKEKIRRFVLFHFEFLKKNKKITSVIFSEHLFQSDQRLRKNMLKVLSGRRELLENLIRECQKKGLIDDVGPGIMALLIMGTIRMAVLEWRMSGFKHDLYARGEEIMDSLEKLIFE